MSGWQDRRRAAVEREALATATDPAADERTRRHARRELTTPALDWSRLDDDQQTTLTDLTSLLYGQPLEPDAASARAAAAQRLADAWRAVAQATISGRRTPIEGCSRCKRFTDEDLADLDAVVPLMLPPGDPDHE